MSVAEEAANWWAELYKQEGKDTYTAWELVKPYARYIGRYEQDIGNNPASNGYLRRLFKGGAIKINGRAVRDPDTVIEDLSGLTIRIANRTVR